MTRLHKCFAIDCSGSTSGSGFYHENVRLILDSKFEDGDEIIVWDSNSKYISLESYMDINRKRKGYGCTYPQYIFDSIFKKYNEVNYSEFILISDGYVSNSDIEKTDRIIQENRNRFNCEYTEVYLFGNYANLSVACPFTRFNSSKTIVKTANSTEDQVISVSDEDLNTIKEFDNINTLDEFEAKYDSLEKAFIVRLLGTSGDQKLRISVLKMQKRINADNATKKENINQKIDQLILEDKNYDEAKEEAIKCFTSVLGNEFQVKINNLIRMCDGGLKQIFDINKLQTFRDYTADNTTVNEVDDIQDLNIESSVKDSQWECPISIDNEIDPMILITTNDGSNEYDYSSSSSSSNSSITPILVGFDKNTTEKIINCPLNALYIPEFMEKLKSFIDHSISLKNYRASLTTSNPICKSPFTRKRIVGGIPLGENEEHVKAANWTLMKIITGGKDLGDKNLWFFVIYMMIKQGSLPYLKDIEPFVKAQVLYRFKNYKTSISLSGLTNFPQTRVYYPTAAWTCLISPFLIPKIPENLNLFYLHLIHYHELLEILDLFQLELPKEFYNYASRIEIFSKLLVFFKRNPKLLNMYKRGIENRSIPIHVDLESPLKSGGICGDLFIPVDGEIDKEVQLQCLQKFSSFGYQCILDGKTTMDEISWLLNLVDIQKNLSDINVNVFIEGKKETDALKMDTNYNEYWKEWDDNIDKFKVEISEKTCRPYYYVKEGVTWLDELRKIVSTYTPILSLDKHFGNYVCSYYQYPTKDEYILYLYRRVCLGSYTPQTLPKQIRKFADKVFERYQPIMEKYSANEFIKIFEDNTSIPYRIKNERS
ncbi:hypothetical protein BCR32DRAFT_326884 [Anaeromyces robustus]|uniref:Uncharacterized protein n=1 Tax=Anaeromyces robustus TaxID=1754192 RepID=A0A1Y1X967_9FUNG|nr:hypothetical protein BCR32DRAFT_326884 [Anaeromyces robustus]|eukprot:ORX82321.1 hypothetical protein BCR32DRAFT_326884 [Anaeromyces robustus]